MITDAAIEFIRCRMKDMGHNRYHIRLRHFVLQPAEVRKIETPSQFFFLAAPAAGVRIESTAGLFDMAETATNELQYEHQGAITMTNYSTTHKHVVMLQAVFKTK